MRVTTRDECLDGALHDAGVVLERWIEPRPLPRYGGNRRRLAGAITRGLSLGRPVSEERPLGDPAVCLRLLGARWPGLSPPTEIAGQVRALVKGRNAIVHRLPQDAPTALRALSRLVALLGAASESAAIDRRVNRLEQQGRDFPLNVRAPDTLVVAPCSAHKVKFPAGPQGSAGDEGVIQTLRRAGEGVLAGELSDERVRVARPAGVDEDECGLMPAYLRYEGTLWKAGTTPRRRLREAVEAGARLVLISGGYGLVHARERIGYYDIELEDAHWRANVIERTLAAYASAIGAKRVVALLRLPAYQRVVRKAPWGPPVGSVDVLTPEMLDGPAASDATLGEALETLLSAGSGAIARGWTGTDGPMLVRERVR